MNKAIFNASLFFLLFCSEVCAQKIVIIGAGLAGLSAAYRLQKEGHQVEIYEARQRPGGRTCSCYFPDGYSELGGQSIFDGGEGKNIRELAKELGVEVVIYKVKRDIRCLDGDNLIHWSCLYKNAPKPTSMLYEKLQQCNTMSEVLDELVGTKKTLLRSMLEVRTAGYEGCNANKISKFYFDSYSGAFWNYYKISYRDSFLDEDRYFDFCTVKNGMSKLIEALVKPLKSAIHYNCPLKELARNKKGGFVLTVADKKIEGDKIILALPYSTLRDVKIEEGIFPKDQFEFMKSLQYGTNAKILIPTQGTTSQLCGFNGHCFTIYENPIMWCYFGGDNGIFDSTTQEGVSQFFNKHINSYKKLYPTLTFDENIAPVKFTEKPFVKAEHAVAISWINEPYSKGSYSCLAPGQEVEYQKTVIDCGQEISKPFRSIEKSIFIAGEHAAFESSTMEGAVESGERAAQMVINSLSK